VVLIFQVLPKREDKDTWNKLATESGEAVFPFGCSVHSNKFYRVGDRSFREFCEEEEGKGRRIKETAIRTESCWALARHLTYGHHPSLSDPQGIPLHYLGIRCRKET
jgi:hypothetical protein